ncbi:MAG: CotH kinase family protein, partial [Verrucomicrobiota bacterium]
LTDSDGDHPDWIEIYNAGAKPVSLLGCYLSDNPENLSKWKFPVTTAAPGQFVKVFASGKNRAGHGEYHTNFRLKNGGEFLALVAPDGRKIYHSIESRFKESAASFGLPFVEGTPESTDSIVSFDSPTPGKANPASGGPPVTAGTRFSVDRGFYNEPILVRLSCSQPGAVIHFTTDGSEPGPDNGILYEGPIQISNTCTLRAVAVAPGHNPGEVNTHTYIFSEDVITQSDTATEGWPDRRSRQRMRYGMQPAEAIGSSEAEMEAALRSIPSLSIVTDSNHLFDPSTGIYTNAQRRGPEWERPVSFELIDPSGSEPGFQANGGLRIRGGFSRSGRNPKHAFRVYFRKKYGEGKLEYPLFGAEGADSFNDIDLRTAQNYSWSFQSDPQNSFIREVFSRDTQRDMGQPYTRSRYYHLYLNGLYWGLYQTQEHAEASYGAAYFGGSKEDYDVVKSGGFEENNSIEATDGNLNGWHQTWQLANRIAREQDPLLQKQFYQELQGLAPNGEKHPDYPIYIDVDNLIDYMLVIIYTGNWDAPIPRSSGTRNWFGVWNRKGTRGFAFFAHDAEHSLGVNQSLNINRTGPYEAGSQFQHCNPQWVHQQLMAVPEYCESFGNRAHTLLSTGGLLSPEVGIERINARASEIEQAIIAESARWGNRRLTKRTWESELESLRFYLAERRP